MIRANESISKLYTLKAFDWFLKYFLLEKFSLYVLSKHDLQLHMWHKNTNFNLRKIDRKKENMYKSLLQLSTTKKKIKNVRQSKKKDEEDRLVWLQSKRRPERRRNIFAKHKGLTLDERK